MGKQDRYNFDGADDSFESDTTPAVSAPETTSEEPPADPEPGPATGDTQQKAAEQPAEIPHRVRYDSPKDGRKAKTFYLDADQDLARLRELQSLAEIEFEETVHRLDVYLAAFRSDLSDDGFLDEMQRIGYGYFD